MGVAIAAAQRAEGRSAPNPPVGCAIIDKQGRLVAVGHTARGGRPHRRRVLRLPHAPRASGFEAGQTAAPGAAAEARAPGGLF